MVLKFAQPLPKGFIHVLLYGGKIFKTKLVSLRNLDSQVS